MAALSAASADSNPAARGPRPQPRCSATPPAKGNVPRPRVQEIALDTTVIAFHLAICVADALLFGLLPALRASRSNLSGAMKAASRGATTDRSGLRIRGALVVSEIALALVLLA